MDELDDWTYEPPPWVPSPTVTMVVNEQVRFDHFVQLDDELGRIAIFGVGDDLSLHLHSKDGDALAHIDRLLEALQAMREAMAIEFPALEVAA